MKAWERKAESCKRKNKQKTDGEIEGGKTTDRQRTFLCGQSERDRRTERNREQTLTNNGCFCMDSQRDRKTDRPRTNRQWTFL